MSIQQLSISEWIVSSGSGRDFRHLRQKRLGEVLRKNVKHNRYLLLKRYSELTEAQKSRADHVLQASAALSSAHF